MKMLAGITLIALSILLFSCKKDKGNAPIILLHGNNPTQSGLGYPYHDAGAVATDKEDGDLTSKIIITSDVDTGAIGTYHVNFNVTDSDGNAAAEVTREVIIAYFK
jgi:hypothetical protein